MNDELTLGTDPLTELLSNQFGAVHVWHPRFLGEGPDALIVFGLILGFLFAGAILCRWSLYASARMTGHWRLEKATQYRETVAVGIAFGAGFVIGEIFFRNALLSALSGGFFMLMCTGVVLEAMVVTSRDPNATAKRPTRPTVPPR